MGGANDGRVKGSRLNRAEAWIDVSSVARSLHPKCSFDCTVYVSAELWSSVTRIPFCDLGAVSVCDRLREVLTRAAIALERLRQERCMKRGEDWPPERRCGLRFAAEIPIESAGPRFRHVCLVIGPGAGCTPILKIGEGYQLSGILKPMRPLRKRRSPDHEKSPC